MSVLLFPGAEVMYSIGQIIGQIYCSPMLNSVEEVDIGGTMHRRSTDGRVLAPLAAKKNRTMAEIAL
jgi:hypothetical protein